MRGIQPQRGKAWVQRGTTRRPSFPGWLRRSEAYGDRVPAAPYLLEVVLHNVWLEVEDHRVTVRRRIRRPMGEPVVVRVACSCERRPGVADHVGDWSANAPS